MFFWNDDLSGALGSVSDFEDRADFLQKLKDEFYTCSPDCEITKIGVTVESCIMTEKGIPRDSVIPLSATDVVIENFFTAEIEYQDKKESVL